MGKEIPFEASDEYNTGHLLQVKKCILGQAELTRHQMEN